MECGRCDWREENWGWRMEMGVTRNGMGSNDMSNELVKQVKYTVPTKTTKTIITAYEIATG